MAKQARWVDKPIVNGIWEIEFSSWKYFHDYVRQQMLDYSHYVWRGQRDADWKLESSLDRILKSKLPNLRNSLAQKHLDSFKLAVRGRRGANPSPIVDENEWWALGQHHGLATPLLDWTESAFVALYFAFEKAAKPQSGRRAVWALTGGQKNNEEIIKQHQAAGNKGKAPILEFIRPHQNDNARLVSQAGLFTRAPLGQTTDGWIAHNNQGQIHQGHLLKLTFPDTNRTECLRTLTKMNINHITLFPDLYGAGQHCNKALQIDKY
jgi:hypothetical protein